MRFTDIAFLILLIIANRHDNKYKHLNLLKLYLEICRVSVKCTSSRQLVADSITVVDTFDFNFVIKELEKGNAINGIFIGKY